MSPREGGPSAGTNAALPAEIQEGGRQALPLFGKVDPEDGRGTGDSQRVFEEMEWLCTKSRGSNLYVVVLF